MAPGWLTVLAWFYLSVCFCCAGLIAVDIAVNRRRQPMGVMNFVFPITALYFARSRSRCTGGGVGRLLAPHAGRHDHRVLHLVARQCLAVQPGHRGGHVTRAG